MGRARGMDQIERRNVCVEVVGNILIRTSGSVQNYGSVDWHSNYVALQAGPAPCS
jgi:hypothetical protein